MIKILYGYIEVLFWGAVVFIIAGAVFLCITAWFRILNL